MAHPDHYSARLAPGPPRSNSAIPPHYSSPLGFSYARHLLMPNIQPTACLHIPHRSRLHPSQPSMRSAVTPSYQSTVSSPIKRRVCVDCDYRMSWNIKYNKAYPNERPFHQSQSNGTAQYAMPIQVGDPCQEKVVGLDQSLKGNAVSLQLAMSLR